VISLSLNGKLNFWKIEGLSDGKEPDFVLNGHQNYVLKVVYNKLNETVISADTNGKILQWDMKKNASIVHHLHNCKVISLALSSDNKVLYSLGFDLNVIAYDLACNKVIYEVKVKTGEPQNIQASRSAPNVVYVLNHNCVFTIKDGKIESEKAFNFEARAFAVGDKDVFIGDRDGILHIFDETFNFVQKMNLHQSEITCLKLSNNGNLLATGDNQKFVKVLKVATKELYTDDYEYHKAKIYDLSWSDNDEKLCSGSLDRNVILWDIATKKKVKIYPDLDNEVVLTVAFFGNSSIFCGGHCCSLVKINLN